MTVSKGVSARSAADDIAEMMRAWGAIEAAARREFPGADAEKIYQITKGAMNHAIAKAGAA